MKFIPILKSQEFSISKRGIIINTNGEIVHVLKSKSDKFVNLNGIIYDVSKLILEAFVGYENFEYAMDISDIDSLEIDNIHYVIKTIEYFNDHIMINGAYFKILTNYPNFAISKTGTVFSIKRQKFIARTIAHNGYLVVTIHNEAGYRAPVKVHRLVYSAYCGELIDGMVIDHIDGVKVNPYYMNLEQVTPGENTRRSLTMGLQPGKRWDSSEIEHICQCIQDGMSMEEIYPIYSTKCEKKVFIMLIHTLRHKKLFGDITSNYNLDCYAGSLSKKDRKLSEKDVTDILNLLEDSNNTLKTIATRFGVSANTIAKIRDGKTWKYLHKRSSTIESINHPEMGD